MEGVNFTTVLADPTLWGLVPVSIPVLVACGGKVPVLFLLALIHLDQLILPSSSIQRLKQLQIYTRW